MRACNFFIAALAALVLSTLVVGQYDEECHYQCIQVYCDLFDDYCDYDCHEVCYPYRAVKSHSQHFHADVHRGFDVKGAFGDQERHQPLRSILRHEHESRQTGKAVRMRLHKALRPASRDKTAAGTKSSSPSTGSFALFQDCLASRSTRRV